MEQVLKRPPWWAWFSLMGLEIPSAAIAWAFAVSQSHLVVVSSPWLYQFLFVAVWCVNMLDRVLKIFRGGSAVYTDECLLFAKKHCFVISLLIMVAAVTGLWIMFFQLGVVIFQLPCILPRSIAGIRPANQEEACARIPLNSNGKISAAQDSVCRRRGGMFIFSLSSTNMNAPAIASP